MSDDKITVFASGNGDTILFQAHGFKILTDINYRAACTEDEDSDDLPDFAPELRKACSDGHLDIFVLTHPDKDHLCGFTDFFHTGNPDDNNDKILVDEMWCSPYAATAEAQSDVAKLVLDEIKRRKRLLGTTASETSGNRLKILDSANTPKGQVHDCIKWRLLAPTPSEANIPISLDPDCPNSSNPSSLVLRWTITVSGVDNLILTGGDSTVAIWERIHDDYHADKKELLEWHLLIAPHHCSRYTLGDKEDERFTYSDKALEALGHQSGSGYVISSSKKIVNDDDDPPSHQAKQKYLGILAGGTSDTSAAEERFLCTGSHDDDKPAHITLLLTKVGPSLKRVSGLAAATPMGAKTTSYG